MKQEEKKKSPIPKNPSITRIKIERKPLIIKNPLINNQNQTSNNKVQPSNNEVNKN